MSLKFKRIIISLICVVLFQPLVSNDAYAMTASQFKNLQVKEVNPATIKGSIALEADTTYQYDLNGDGKEEKIKYTVGQDGFDAVVNIYIDGKKKVSKKDSTMTFYASLSNIDKNDKYLEISVMGFGGDNYMSSLGIYRYTKKSEKITTLFQFPSSDDIYWLDFATEMKTEGDGTFIWPSGGVNGIGDYCDYTEVHEGMLTLGSARDIVFELKDNKIMVKSKEFTAAGSKFTTLKTIKLLDKASSKGKVKATVKSGNSVIVKKIKYVKDGEAYLYIQYGSKKGWYHLKGNLGFVFKL